MTRKKRKNEITAGYEEITRTLLNHVCAPEYQPVKKSRLWRDCGIPPAQRQLAEQVLDRLVFDGVLVHLKHKGIALAQSADLVKGRITFIRSGAAYVNSLDGKTEVYVPAKETGTAMPGDHVLVRVSYTRHRGRDSIEGTVLRVLERARRTLVGELIRSRKIWYVQPMHSQIQHDVVVPDAGGAELGDLVLVRLEDWDDPRMLPEGEVIEVIGPADDPALDTIAVMKSCELPERFPAEVVAEAETADITEADYNGRLDLRDKFIFTIDPKTARDFDDAISLEMGENGNWVLGVHIADVSHFVHPDTLLDEEAEARGTSVYFPDRVVPMLPVQLSNGVCSLVPNQDRLAFSAIMEVTPDGDVLDCEFHESVIHSKLRLTYHQAWAALTSAKGAGFAEWKMDKDAVELVKTCNTLARKVRAKRMAAGALQMELPEVDFEIGPDGRIAKITPVVNDESHQLIEEFMLLTNEAVCRTLAQAGRPQIHRIHEEPDPEKLMELEEMFVRNGIDPGDLTDRLQLAKLLESIETEPRSHAWYLAVLRSMKRACYSHENLGHYGLAKEFYAHFTSPIRRYPDLITHRLLKDLLNQRPPTRKDLLAEMAVHASEREQVATEAEREVVELKKIRFFKEQLESGDLKEYDAIVTEIRNFGMFIDIPSIMTFGLIPLSHLEFDFFDFDASGQEIKGRRTGLRYRPGNRVKVIIAKVDEARRELDFTISTTPQPKKKSRRADKSKSRRGRRRRQ